MAAPSVVDGNGSPTVSVHRTGVLEVFLLALDIEDLPADESVDRTGFEPFLPATHVDPARTHLPVRLAAARREVPTAADGPQLVLGTDSGAIHVGRSADCLSLWSVPGHGAVLACEALVADAGEDCIDWHTGTLNATVDRLLAPFGLTTASRLHDLFPGLDVSSANVPLAGLVCGTGHDRASAGVAIEVTGNGGARVRHRAGGSGTDAAGWAWESIALVDRPVRDDAAIAVREDAGAILFDLDATADDHDHDVFGVSEMIRALVPWVAVRARHTADYRLVLDHLRDHETLEDGRLLAALDDVAAVQARRMERVLLVTEARHDGVSLPRMSPAQLRTVLVRRLSDEMTVLDAELGEATRVIERALLRSAERRGSRHSRIAQAWSVAASAIAVVAVFAALAAVPAVEEPTLFGHWLEALVATIAITAGVVVVAVFWRRPS
ncbi:hypothetical protein [Prescottella defluvii]|uniref:hypothetical protein n=1 Tax=Prescottella defluvii TaxID=1323361 RepID=UPI0004F23CEA|nr:hypothetical protein [Prescottella defluvii]